MKRISLLSIFLVCISLSLFSQTPVERNGRVYIKGTKMYNAKGEPTQLKGLASHGLQWYDNCYTKESLKAIRDDWKADMFRITVYVNEDGYNTDTAKYIKRIDQIISWCEELGLYYMVDWHVLSPGDPLDKTYSGSMAFFSYMAKKHGKSPNIIFELCNEPNPNVDRGGPDWNRIKSYAEPIIAEIRKYSQNICVVGTPQWSQMPSDVVGHEIKAENVMYSFHFYAASHSNLKINLTSVYNKIPMFITEWGIGSAQELENVVDTVEAYDWLSMFKRNKVTWSYWSYSDKGNTASLLEANACAEKAWTKTNQAGAFMRNYLVGEAKMDAEKTFNIFKSETDKDGKMIKLTFATKLKSVSADNLQKFSVTINGKPVVVKSFAISGDSATLNVSVAQAILIGDKVSLSYQKGSIKSVENYSLMDYKNLPILNTVPPPGLFGVEETFDNNTLSNDWYNTETKLFTYTATNKALKISANYTETGWLPFSYHVPNVSMLHTPTVTLRMKSDVDFLLRIDVADETDKRTNMNDLTIPIKASDKYETYTFDFTGKFFQMYPNFQKVDQSKIKIIYFYANPGKSFSGNIYIDDLIVGKKL